MMKYLSRILLVALPFLSACQPARHPVSKSLAPATRPYRDAPLVSSIYTADPSAHVFNNHIYIYASHDDAASPPLDAEPPFTNAAGNEYNMRDYHVISMDSLDSPVIVHRVALTLTDVPWAARQLWAPDAAQKGDTYYLYFPAKDREGAFRIGVATSHSPTGPFHAQPLPMKNSFSIDPAVFTDDDGQSYLYFGGLEGGQLQANTSGHYDPQAPSTVTLPPDAPALCPKVARLADNMLELAEPPHDLVILDPATGKPLLAGDTKRRFFEASWMHKYNGLYYFSYSTGTTHLMVYATSTSPTGPFTFRGTILLPPQGWTTHGSIVEIDRRWWLFYADAQLSNNSHLRNVKMTELHYNVDRSIQMIDPFK